MNRECKYKYKYNESFFTKQYMLVIMIFFLIEQIWKITILDDKLNASQFNKKTPLMLDLDLEYTEILGNH